MPAADLEEALQKKGGLTLEQLMIYDDIATDALVDRVYFWSTIRKARPNTRPSRGNREDEICRILQNLVIVEKDAASAQVEILKQHGLMAFMRTLHTTDEREHFERHIRKYVNIYLPECPFEVCTTYRYTIVNAEACVKARKPIKAGDTIKYLTGIQVELSEEEEQGLSSRTDFSIVLSSRRKRPSLFLGPARFANHDCDSNARLTTTGAHGLSIVARRSIAVNEEITVTYGDDYFGENNCECLCGTCERLLRNGWDPQGPLLQGEHKDDEDDDGAFPPRKRQRVEPSTAMRNGAGAAPQQTSSLLTSTYSSDRANLSVTALLPAQVNVPRKRGRPRKHPLPADRITTAHTINARDLLARWFGHRGGQLGGDPDLFRLRSNAPCRFLDEDHNESDIPADKMHYKKINAVYELMAERGTVQLRKLSSKLSIMNKMTAKLLKITANEVEQYYYPPGHLRHVPLPTPPPSDDASSPRLKREQTEEALSRPGPPDLSSFRAHDREARAQGTVNDILQSMITQTNSLLQSTTVAIQGHTAKANTPYTASQVALDPPKRKRGRPRKHPLPEPVVEQVTARVLTTSSSIITDDQSVLSTSSLPRQQDHATPDTSVSGAELFNARNICQNIVEMFTSDSPNDVMTQEYRNGERRGRSSTKDGARSEDGHESVMINSIEDVAMDHETTRSEEHPGDDEEDEKERRGPPRTPGDYHMTPALLIDINDRWIECRNCEEYFVQHDAYLTRIACPRCERHSKLYGYHWPKTDKLGRDDKDERVLDHRLIHRFIDPEEERLERKGRKTVFDALKDRELSSSQEIDSDERGGSRDDSRRRSRRVFSYA